jgi:hypothetical protein
MIHSENTFSTSSIALLSAAGYCIGYNIDGKPERAMAVHPGTGMIVRKFWGGASIWHPSTRRRDERVSNGATAMESTLAHEGAIKQIPQYSIWHARPHNTEKLAALMTLGATVQIFND